MSIVDLDIPFWRMVDFMVKWSFAAIPAIIIVCFFIAIIFFLFGTLLRGP